MPIILFFTLLNTLFISGRHWLARWGVDQEVLLVGNVILFIITLISAVVARKGLNSANPHAFLRSVYGSILLKLFLCIIAAFVYIAIVRKQVNKPALFICMGLYLVYTFMEVGLLTRMLRDKKNG